MNNLWMILFAAQAVVALVAFLFENGKENRFEEEKLTFPQLNRRGSFGVSRYPKATFNAHIRLH